MPSSVSKNDKRNLVEHLYLFNIVHVHRYKWDCLLLWNKDIVRWAMWKEWSMTDPSNKEDLCVDHRIGVSSIFSRPSKRCEDDDERSNHYHDREHSRRISPRHHSRWPVERSTFDRRSDGQDWQIEIIQLIVSVQGIAPDRLNRSDRNREYSWRTNLIDRRSTPTIRCFRPPCTSIWERWIWSTFDLEWRKVPQSLRPRASTISADRPADPWWLTSIHQDDRDDKFLSPIVSLSREENRSSPRLSFAFE